MTESIALVVPEQQILQGVAATIEWTYLDGNGEPSAIPDGYSGVSAAVVSSNGDEVSTGAATPDTTEPGRYTYSLTPSDTADLDLFDVTWTLVSDA